MAGMWIGALANSDGSLYNRSLIPQQQSAALESRVRDLEYHIRRLSLLNQALWELLRERAKLTDAELERMVREIDLRDGVEDGAITAKITPEHPTERNHYLVYQGGKLGDFELKLRHRIMSKETVNGGFQFRSEIFNGEITDDCRGYQVDNNTNTPWLVRLYDEFGRHDLALRGEKTVFGPDGSKNTTPLAEAVGEPWFKLDEWHEYHLICRGAELTLKVDGRLVAEVVDNDPKQQDFAGILALQLHSGPPMTVQFKDIRLKKLDAALAKP